MRTHPLTAAERAIHRLLQDRRLLQEELAALVGYDPGHMSRCLSGQHALPLRVLAPLAAAGFREPLEAEVLAAGGRIEWDETPVNVVELHRTATERGVSAVGTATDYASTACAAEAPSSPGGRNVTRAELSELAQQARRNATRWHQELAILERQLRTYDLRRRP
ncbi:MAG: hypothetical protein AMXMBFR64_04920 [Myxococcales bacterium]